MLSAKIRNDSTTSEEGTVVAWEPHPIPLYQLSERIRHLLIEISSIDKTAAVM